jgi:hypothetical protein
MVGGHTSTQVTFCRVFVAMLPAEAPDSLVFKPETVARTSDSGTFNKGVMQASTKSGSSKGTARL